MIKKNKSKKLTLTQQLNRGVNYNADNYYKMNT